MQSSPANTSTVSRLYRRFRRHSPFMLAGCNAEQSLRAARTLDRFRDLELQGRVKIEAEFDSDPDPSFYDNWEHLSERSRDELKQRYCDDCYVVSTYAKCSKCSEWCMVDGIGGCSGYSDPCDPFENCCVIDLMRAAIEYAGG